MGTGVVFGMTISTVIGLFLIPVCYVFVQRFSDRRQPAAKPEPAPAAEHSH
jgi:HAE1 family hydrophobic/amphiphilic exporter-1/multidrug efflux pump